MNHCCGVHRLREYAVRTTAGRGMRTAPTRKMVAAHIYGIRLPELPRCPAYDRPRPTTDPSLSWGADGGNCLLVYLVPDSSDHGRDEQTRRVDGTSKSARPGCRVLWSCNAENCSAFLYLHLHVK